MSRSRRLVRRGVIVAFAAAALGSGSAAIASAHIEVSSPGALPGGYATIAFQVPNESTAAASTTVLTVQLPDTSGVRAEAKPGWRVTLDRDADKVRSVTWTAAPDAGIGADQFGVFRVALKLPDTATVSFPATQTYADGTVVKWDQPSAPGGAEPEHPAPTLTLTTGAAPATSSPKAPGVKVEPSPAPPPPAARKVVDTTSRVLAGAALLVGALGVGLALIVRRP